MKRALLFVAVLTTFSGLAAGCGPDEKYCYDQHSSCTQAKALDEARKKEKEEMEREAERMRLEAGVGGMSDGGSIVLD